jgi:hypothetical protein
LENKDTIKDQDFYVVLKCCFCNKDESIQHLFFERPLAKSVWRLVHTIFGLARHKNMKNLFDNWLVGIDKKDVKKKSRLVSMLLFGLFGMHGMIKSLTNLKLSPFCMFN